ncbi:MAG: hypothetical protein J5844_03050 [Clostridia bacterium]|nr:hypothetical protein [Clostridia bacterium]
MKLTIWDLFRFLLKGKWTVFTVTVLATVITLVLVNANQTYTAKTIIQYADNCVSEGYNLKGEAFDAKEIISPSVMLRVLEDTGRSSQKMDQIRNKITITPIYDTAKVALKEANQKNGVEYEYFPNTFCVEYDGTPSFEQTRSTLNSVINNYFDYYAKTYLYLASVKEIDYSLTEQDFDYIEQAELINNNIKSAVSALSSYSRDSDNYLSPTNGVSFNVLINNFNHIENYLLPEIFEKIYTGPVTKNKALIDNKYVERREEYLRNKESAEYLAEKTKEKMDAYVEANLTVPNAYHDSEAYSDAELGIIKDVDRTFKVTTERTLYDSLFKNYANSLAEARTNALLAEECDNVLKRFEENSNPEKTAANAAEVEALIEECLEELRPIYKDTFDVIDDYNASLVPKHITKLCDICYFPKYNYLLFALVGFIAGFGLSCILVIAFETYALFKKAEKNGKNS